MRTGSFCCSSFTKDIAIFLLSFVIPDTSLKMKNSFSENEEDLDTGVLKRRGSNSVALSPQANYTMGITIQNVFGVLQPPGEAYSLVRVPRGIQDSATR
jgi:hypothetical protein